MEEHPVTALCVRVCVCVLQTMQVLHRAMQWFAVMLLVLTTCQCQEVER